MQTLRRARFLARLVLAGFAMALGLALATPLVKPVAMELVCTAAGSAKLVLTGEDAGSTGQQGHQPECALCLLGSAVPPSISAVAAFVPAQPHDLRPAPSAPLAGRRTAPPPSRGPPAHA